MSANWYCCIAILILSGCAPAATPPATNSPTVNTSPSQLPTNSPVVASGPVRQMDAYVVNSVPVMPGTAVAIVDPAGPTLLVDRTVPTNVRWKIPGPFQSPKYPAEGFVTFLLAESQWEAIKKAGDVSIQPAAEK